MGLDMTNVTPIDRKIYIKNEIIEAVLTPKPKGKYIPSATAPENKAQSEALLYRLDLFYGRRPKNQVSHYRIEVAMAELAEDRQRMAHELLMLAFPQILQRDQFIREAWDNAKIRKRPITPFFIHIHAPAVYASSYMAFYSSIKLRQYFPDL